MREFQTIPDLWLISDARNDARLEQGLRALPRGSGFVFRHYHLDKQAREARFQMLARCARAAGHVITVSGPAELAAAWEADGIYGASKGANQMDAGDAAYAAYTGLKIATAHDEEEIASANAAGADAVMLSPVFATRSHDDVAPLGPERFHAMAKLANMPVIALGGMTRGRAAAMDWPRWAAIDGLC